MRVVALAAGGGTRARLLSDPVPKPVPAGGSPLVGHVPGAAVAAGVDERMVGHGGGPSGATTTATAKSALRGRERPRRP